MGVGLNADGESAYRTSIPSGGAGTLTDGGFANTFAGVWLYRPSSTATYALTAGGAIIECIASARNVTLGFDSAGSVLADLSLQMVFNSGGGSGTPYTFSAHAGDDFLDEWVYYFIAENSTDGQIAGYIPLSTMTPVYQARANDNAGSQYTNTLVFGSTGGGQVVLGYYAYARARYGTGINVSAVSTYAGSDSTISGDWGFWPLADSSDTGDDSGNSRDLAFTGTISSEGNPTLSVPTLTQARYRFRNDDGNESAATWAASENTTISLSKNTPKRLRVQVQTTGNVPSASYKLQYRKVGDPGWQDVN